MASVFATSIVAFASDGAQLPTVEYEAVATEIEPGRIFVADDQGVLSAIRAYHQRPEAESEPVLAELDTLGLNNLPPPFMMEYARREWVLGRGGWAERYLIGRMRALFDAKVCIDPTAGQFKAVVELEFEQFEDFISAYNKDVNENFAAYLQKHMESGVCFQSNASAWWICSHGMDALSHALKGSSKIKLAEWFVGEKERENIKAEALEQLSSMKSN